MQGLVNRLGAGLALLLGSPAAHAYPYTPWTGPTGGGVVAFNPYTELASDGLDLNPWLILGLTDRVDVIAGYTNRVERPTPDVLGPGRLDFLARFAVSDGLIGVVTGGTDLEGATDLGAEVHGSWVGDRFLFTHNTGWSTTLGDRGHSFFTVLAPEVRFARGAWVFLEGSPAVYVGADAPEWELGFTPGVTVAFDPDDENHLFTLALPIGVIPEPSTTFGICYWGAFPLRKR